jgi:voltage-gated potassium channel
MTDPGPTGDRVPDVERWRLLRDIDRVTERPLITLSIVWIALLVVELTSGALPPPLEASTWLIWGLFVADFALGVLIAPDRAAYLRSHWLTALSLVLPAFRVLRLASAFRFLRAGRAARSVGLLRIATSLNRGMNAVAGALGHRGIGFLLALTGLVIPVGAAGMSSFESASPSSAGGSSPFADFGDSLWWTAMTLAHGPSAQPLTGEGRLLAFGLSVYGLAVFGYLTAVLASHFVGRDRLGGR